jgi:hypothetical protein
VKHVHLKLEDLFHGLFLRAKVSLNYLENRSVFRYAFCGFVQILLLGGKPKLQSNFLCVPFNMTLVVTTNRPSALQAPTVATHSPFLHM